MHVYYVAGWALLWPCPERTNNARLLRYWMGVLSQEFFSRFGNGGGLPAQMRALASKYSVRAKWWWLSF
jgi:hypothetical protein